MPGVIPTTVNPEQKAAIEHGAGPLLIVAGAGTGKTTVITQRIAWLILEQHVPIDNLLALTFTEKAATEMEERVDRLLPYGYVNLWISTFHAFCERILRDHAIDIGLPGDFRLLNQPEQWLMIRRHFDRFELKYYRPLGNPTRFIGALLKHFSRLEDEDISPEEYISYARSLLLNQDEETPKRKKRKSSSVARQPETNDDAINEAERLLEVAQAYATYRQLLLDESSLDFGTLITWTLKLFKERPAILKRYREQFQHILVDEFQDTNWAQYELIKLLSAPRNNLTVVGDDDQSIYKFRGASISNILEFRKDFPAARQIVLTKNYRSRQNILDLAYDFIQKNNPNRLEVALSDGVPPVKNKKTLPKISKKLIAVDHHDGLLDFFHCSTQEEEVRLVTEKILELKKSEVAEWKEFAILVRANDQAEAFKHSLETAGIPFQFVASKGLYRDPDVLDALSFLRLLDNYHESPALYRVMNIPEFRISASDIVELAAYARRKGLSLHQAAVQSRAISDISSEGRKGIDRLLYFIKQGTEFSRNRKITEVLYNFLKDAGIMGELGKKDAERAMQRISVLRKFLEEVAAYEKLHPNTSIRDFLEMFQLKLDSGDSGSLNGTAESDADGVRIMTVHGAKGLEFGYVFIVQLVDRRFPTTERRDPIEIPVALVRETLPEGDIHLEEERRLLYVAMTRAKRGLWFTAAEDYGGVKAKKPSRFLYELGFLQSKPPDEQRPLAKLEGPRRLYHPSPDVKFVGTKFSFSALRTYEKCPWQFRYAYVLRVPTGGNALFSYGETLHLTLQKFFELVLERRAHVQPDLFGKKSDSASPKNLIPVTLEELINIFDESFINDWYENEAQRQTFRKRGREALTAFYEKHKDSLPQVFGIEQAFHWKLDQYTIGGKIDRIDQLGHDPETNRPIVRIVDYKSGKTRKKIEAEDSYQLFIYALAAQDPNILNLRVDGLQYYFMEDNAAVEIAPTEKDLKKTEAWVRSSIEKIRSGDFRATPGPEVCRYCDYKDICEFRDPNA